MVSCVTTIFHIYKYYGTSTDQLKQGIETAGLSIKCACLNQKKRNNNNNNNNKTEQQAHKG